LSSYHCSLQVYMQEFDRRMRRLLKDSEHAKAKNERWLFKKVLLSYLLCSLSCNNNIKTFENLSPASNMQQTPPKPIFGPIDPFMVWPFASVKIVTLTQREL